MKTKNDRKMKVERFWCMNNKWEGIAFFFSGRGGDRERQEKSVTWSIHDPWLMVNQTVNYPCSWFKHTDAPPPQKQIILQSDQQYGVSLWPQADLCIHLTVFSS